MLNIPLSNICEITRWFERFMASDTQSMELVAFKCQASILRLKKRTEQTSAITEHDEHATDHAQLFHVRIVREDLTVAEYVLRSVSARSAILKAEDLEHTKGHYSHLSATSSPAPLTKISNMERVL